jgi:hypothetical protein
MDVVAIWAAARVHFKFGALGDPKCNCLATRSVNGYDNILVLICFGAGFILRFFLDVIILPLNLVLCRSPGLTRRFMQTFLPRLNC